MYMIFQFDSSRVTLNEIVQNIVSIKKKEFIFIVYVIPISSLKHKKNISVFFGQKDKKGLF